MPKTVREKPNFAAGAQSNGAEISRIIEGTLGDGSALTYVLTHNFNTRGVHVSVWDTVTPYEELEMIVKKTSLNTVTVEFAIAPTTNQYGWSIHG